MFKPGEMVYFSFCGNWSNGCYNGHYCLPPKYYAFMPIKIESYEEGNEISCIKGAACVVILPWGRRWTLSVDCIKKEFSIDGFILAQLEWGKLMTAEQFKTIVATLN